MIKYRFLPLAALLLAAAGCDFKETRVGQITLATSAGIPLNGRDGRAELVAGRTEITFKKGSGDRSVSIRVRQPNRPEVQLEAQASGDYTTGNFTLKGSEIGQPVDLLSVRTYAVTGPTERDSTMVENGMQICRVDIAYDPCDENWSVAFRAPTGAELGSFAARSATRCNERHGSPYACYRDPSRDPQMPRVPDFPRSANLKFD